MGVLIERARPLTVGDTIRHLRETRTTMSARALSIAIGLSESYVGKVENGTLDPSLRSFAKIAKGLGMSPPEIYVVVSQESTRT